MTAIKFSVAALDCPAPLELAAFYAALTGQDSKFPGEVGWNFTKFLIDRNGQLLTGSQPGNAYLIVLEQGKAIKMPKAEKLPGSNRLIFTREAMVAKIGDTTSVAMKVAVNRFCSWPEPNTVAIVSRNGRRM